MIYNIIYQRSALTWRLYYEEQPSGYSSSIWFIYMHTLMNIWSCRTFTYKWSHYFTCRRASAHIMMIVSQRGRVYIWSVWWTQSDGTKYGTGTVHPITEYPPPCRPNQSLITYACGIRWQCLCHYIHVCVWRDQGWLLEIQTLFCQQLERH